MAASSRKLYALTIFLCLFLLIHFDFSFVVISALVILGTIIALIDLKKRK